MSSKKPTKLKKLSPPKYRIGDVIFGTHAGAGKNTLYLKVGYIVSADDGKDWIYYSHAIAPDFAAALMETNVEGRANELPRRKRPPLDFTELSAAAKEASRVIHFELKAAKKAS